MQIVRELSEEVNTKIQLRRDWVKNHYTPESLKEYNSLQGKLHLLDMILKSDWIGKDEIYKLQSLGITLGDIFIQDMNFVWIEVEDELGTTPAIQFPDTSIILFPLTMISKRITNGEEIDIYQLYTDLKEKINEIKHEA